MTLPASGPISLNQVNVELGLAGTTSINMNQASVRTLFGVPSGAISMSNGYGKSNTFSFTIASNQTNANLRTLAVNAGWNQASNVSATINGGIYISSNGTGTPALTVNGSFPAGVTLINNGFIVGAGGNGGTGYYYGSAGAGGGTALSVSTAISITNNGTVAGGGGGGGGGMSAGSSPDKSGNFAYWTGGGGGGGRSSAAVNTGGGAGGALPPGSVTNVFYGSAGGTGTVSGPGGGGRGGDSGVEAGRGGSGGGWGSAGASGTATIAAPATLPYLRTGPGGGGGGGNATSGNANITWLVTGTRLGGLG